MTFDEVVEHIVRAVEAAGIAVLVVGTLVTFGAAALELRDPERRRTTYPRLRRRLARAILLGLELLLVADIVLTIVVDPDLSSVAFLGAIVAIRIVLSFSLEVEIAGSWPWNRWRAHPTGEQV